MSRDAPSEDTADGTTGPRGWGLVEVVVTYLAAIVAVAVLNPVILSITDVASGTDVDAQPLRAVALRQAVYDLVLLGGALFVVTRWGRGPRRDLGLWGRPLDAPVGAALGVAAQLAISLLYLPIYRLSDVTQEEVEEPARELTDKATGDDARVLLLLLLVVVLAPVVEEVFFRGFVYGAIAQRWGMPWGLIGSSALFALTHLQGLQFGPLLAFGLFACYLRVRTDRLAPSIFAHMAFNAVAVGTLL